MLTGESATLARDDVTIVLEMTGQEVVETELRAGKLCPSPGD